MVKICFIDDFNIFAVQFKALKNLQKFWNWAYVGPLDACSNEQLSDKNDIFVIFNNWNLIVETHLAFSLARQFQFKNIERCFEPSVCRDGPSWADRSMEWTSTVDIDSICFKPLNDFFKFISRFLKKKMRKIFFEVKFLT